jgi:hypothetical protein
LLDVTVTFVPNGILITVLPLIVPALAVTLLPFVMKLMLYTSLPHVSTPLNVNTGATQTLQSVGDGTIIVCVSQPAYTIVNVTFVPVAIPVTLLPLTVPVLAVTVAPGTGIKFTRYVVLVMHTTPPILTYGFTHGSAQLTGLTTVTRLTHVPALAVITIFVPIVPVAVPSPLFVPPVMTTAVTLGSTLNDTR